MKYIPLKLTQNFTSTSDKYGKIWIFRPHHLIATFHRIDSPDVQNCRRVSLERKKTLQRSVVNYL